MTAGLSSHLWQSTWFALSAALLTFAFRNNHAKVRYWLWAGASLKFLLPFAPLMTLGSHFGSAPVARQIAAPGFSVAVERLVQPFPAAVASASVAPVPAIHWTPVVLFALWGCGMLAIGLVRFRWWLRIRAALRAARPLDIPAAVEIRSSPGLLEPGVVGLFRPVLLLPEGIQGRLTPSQLEAVLAHELCHVRRRDNLFAALHMLVEAVFWFHPLVWWIGSRMVEERERACDEGVLSLGAEPRTYADAILSVCKVYVESPLVCVSGVTGANLRRRIQAIMTNRTGERLNPGKKLLLAAAGLSVVTGPVVVGVLIGVGHPTAIRAQSAVAARPSAQVTQVAQAAPQRQTPVPPAATATAASSRLIAILFDLEQLTLLERSRVKESAVEFVRSHPLDRISILSLTDGKVSVIQDATYDRDTLEAAIWGLTPGNGISDLNSGLEQAVKLLAPISGGKAVVHISVSPDRSFSATQPGGSRVMRAAEQANVPVYIIDASAIVAQTAAGVPVIARLNEPRLPAGMSRNEYDRRNAYVAANYGANSAKGRVYLRYGPPDQVEERGTPQGAASVWRYNYLENFHSNVELEFLPGDRPAGYRIAWPQAITTFTGESSVSESLLPALHTPAGTNPIAGLPSRHATFQTYPAGEWHTLTVPLDSFSGRVEIAAEIRNWPASGDPNSVQSFANLRDNILRDGSATLTYQAKFTLAAGSYVCALLVREQATGRTYGETIHFEVK